LRFTAIEAGLLDQRLAETEVELLLHLLFGQPLALPEPQSFDSTGFLRLASAMRSSAPTARPPVSPFRLALRRFTAKRDGKAYDHATYPRLIAECLTRRRADGSPGGFEFSSLPELNEPGAAPIRAQLAECLNQETPDFRGAAVVARSCLSPSSERVINTWFEIWLSYFGDTEDSTTVTDARPAVPMREMFQQLVDTPPASFYAMLPAGAPDAELFVAAIDGLQANARNALNHFGAAMNRTELRAWSRENVATHEQPALTEFAEQTYHRVLYEAAGSTQDVNFYAVPSERPEEVTSLIGGILAGILPPRSKESAPARNLNVPLGISPSPRIVELLRPDQWDDVWRIMGQPPWRSAVDTLHTSMQAAKPRSQRVHAVGVAVESLADSLRSLPIKVRAEPSGVVRLGRRFSVETAKEMIAEPIVRLAATSAVGMSAVNWIEPIGDMVPGGNLAVEIAAGFGLGVAVKAVAHGSGPLIQIFRGGRTGAIRRAMADSTLTR
jgi:hypothetical protein